MAEKYTETWRAAMRVADAWAKKCPKAAPKKDTPEYDALVEVVAGELEAARKAGERTVVPQVVVPRVPRIPSPVDDPYDSVPDYEPYRRRRFRPWLGREAWLSTTAEVMGN